MRNINSPKGMPRQHHSNNKKEATREILKPIVELCNGKVYRILIIAAISTIAYGVIMPFLPTLFTNYFANLFNDKDYDSDGQIDVISCTSIPHEIPTPQVCIKAHSTVVICDTAKLLAANLILAIVLNPLFARWSDMYGRKPFLLLGLFFSAFPTLIAYIYLKFGNPPLWTYYIAKCIELSFYAPSIAFAWVADKVSAGSRGVIFSFLSSSYMGGLFLGTLFRSTGIVVDVSNALIVSLTIIGICFVSTLIFLPESINEQTRLWRGLSEIPVEDDLKCNLSHVFFRPFKLSYKAIRILGRSRMFFCVALVYMILEAVNTENFDIEIQYYQEVSGFGTKEQAVYQCLKFGGYWIAGTVLFWAMFMVFRRTQTQVVTIGLGACAIRTFALAWQPPVWLIYLMTAVSSVEVLILPTVRSVVSQNVSVREQGSVQGAMSAAKSIASGFGPLILLIFFIVFRLDSLYFPGAFYLVMCFFLCLGIVIIWLAQIPEVAPIAPTTTLEKITSLEVTFQDFDLEEFLKDTGSDVESNGSENGNKDGFRSGNASGNLDVSLRHGLSPITQTEEKSQNDDLVSEPLLGDLQK